MRTVKLTLAYDGTAYAGWQSQPDRLTVQGVLEAAIEQVTGRSSRTLASGRTDTGVHAFEQVVGFRTTSQLSAAVLRRAINARLPDDVAVLDLVDATENFHPIRDVLRKRYRYLIYDGPVRDVFRRNYAWKVQVPLDVPAMDRAAQALVGTHDFRSFQTQGAPRKTTVRTVYELSVRRGEEAENSLVTLEIEANGFLYNMVRAIVGSLVEVGRGRRPESWIAEALASADRRLAGPTAPPHGLYLLKVRYRV